jgi:hypothetical protein
MFNNADLWHSGTFNYSPAPRLAVTAGFSPGRSSALKSKCKGCGTLGRAEPPAC